MAKQRRNTGRSKGSRSPKREYSNLASSEYQYRKKRQKKSIKASSTARTRHNKLVKVSVLMGCLVLLGLYVRIPSVTVYSLNDGQIERRAEYELTAEELVSSFWGSYSLFDRSEFRGALEEQFPSRITAVESVYKGFFGSLRVEVVERVPLFSYDSSAAAGEFSRFVDIEGHVVDVGDREDYVPKTHLRDLTALNVQSGPVITTQATEYVSAVTDVLTQSGVQVQYFDVSQSAIREVSLYLRGEDYEIILQTDTNPDRIGQDILRALNEFKDTNSPKQYLDLRIEGEAAYK